ncbi:hypothetical protein OJ253_1497 [Cryptosporidium canis]|uniref:HTH OST-type domain-containing protein n=1 Tax=Cryptosporidium canis TaxID=195482 RepID=A0A9D5DNI9_9CRYT|nr:hypothetical protein OJ253_1497 [Cryptosporidium canis]
MDSFLNNIDRVEHNKPSLSSIIESEFSYYNAVEIIESLEKKISYHRSSLSQKPNLRMNSARLFNDRVGREVTVSGSHIGMEKRLDLIRDALISLYVDRTKPHLQELFRRLKERVDLDTNYNLQTMIKDLSGNEKEFLLFDNGEIYLRNYYVPEDHWVDPKDPNNPYSREIWSGFLQYINDLVSARGEINVGIHFGLAQSLNNSVIESRDRRYELALEPRLSLLSPSVASSSSSSCSSLSTISTSSQFKSHDLHRYQFKGGRYGVALEIYKAKISNLESLSLGELSHLVQLAINMGILQYENNVLKPRCTCTKIAAAALTVDIDQIESEGVPVDKSKLQMKSSNNLTKLKYELHEILTMYPNGILLSLLKRLYNTYWGKKLSPTVFGYTHISTLLLSDELKQICRLYFDSLNHVIVQSTQFNIPENVKLLEDEKFQKKNSSLDIELLSPIRNMNDISFEYMRLLNKT